MRTEDDMDCPECHKHRDYDLCKVCKFCTNCCDCEETPLEHLGLQIINLEAKVADLEAKLADRPVVWVLRSKSSGSLIKTGDHPDVYVLEHANQFSTAIYTVEPYKRGAR